MTLKILSVLAALAMLVPVQQAFSAETNSASAELKEIVSQINTKLKSGKTSEADLAPELKAMDALIAAHKSESPETLAQILSMKASLYLQALDEPAKAEDIFKQIKQEYPNTAMGRRVDQVLPMIEQQIAKKKIRDTLAVGARFPSFAVTNLAGKEMSLSDYKGKTVLVDFWATWCPPCRAELPNVIAVYQKFHDKGFDIVGVSLDEDKDKLEKFLATNKMPWPQYFDGEGWQNSLAQKYGIESIPATYLLDGEGKIIAKDLRGEELEDAVSKAVAKK